MGREIRNVPHDWDHPRKEDGAYQPLYDECYDEACQEWYANCIENNGRYKSDDGTEYWYHEWDGGPPDEKYYRKRAWKPEEATCIQVYETVSEGTPVTPVFATKGELIDYLCEHGDFWDQSRRKDGCSFMECAPWSRANAESFVETGFAFSGVIANGVIHGPSTQGEVLGPKKEKP